MRVPLVKRFYMNDKAIGNDSLKTTIMEYLVSPGIRCAAA